MMNVDELVKKAETDGASDIHVICNLPPKYRKDGTIQDMDTEIMTADDCVNMAKWIAGDAYEILDRELDRAA